MTALRRFLAGLSIIIGASAIGGAMFAVPTLPDSEIEGTIFRSYLVPGLALALLVGVPLVNAGLLLGRDHELAAPATIAAGIALVIFEIVEALTIGLANLLQPLMFVVGALIALGAFWLWWEETSTEAADAEWLGGHPNIRMHIR